MHISCLILFSSLAVLEAGGTLGEDIEHAVLELRIRDVTIIVSINLTHNFSPDFLSLLGDSTTAEHSPKFVRADSSITVLIEDLEGLLEVWFGEQLDFVESRCDELRVVNITIAIAVSFFHHGYDIRFLEIENLGDGRHILLELLKREFAVVIGVPLRKHRVQIFQLLRLRHQVDKNGAHSRLELVSFGEVVEICRQIKLRLIVKVFRIDVVLYPFVRQHLLH